MATICLVRHGDRFDSNNYEEWQNLPRFKENSHDTPLSELGFAEILKLKGHIPEVDYIYTSPMTRCVQTALQLQTFLDAPIRLEYGITEPGRVVDDGHSLPQIIDGQFVKLQSTYDDHNGKRLISNIDSKLFPDSIFDLWPQLDRSYTSYIRPQDHPFMEDLVSYGNRMVKMINYFSNLHARVLLVGHSGLVTFGANYVTGNPTFFKLSQGPNAGGKKHTGLLVKHNFLDPNSTEIINPDDL
jgi:broad specificity phosphatase PhoE